MENKNALRDLTFSILIEAENVSTAGLERLRECLATLEAQDISLAEALLLIESGQLTAETQEHLRSTYPWLTIYHLDSNAGYGRMKGHSAEVVPSDILVLCDSDCQYEQGWLNNILAPLQENPDVHIVAGETTTPIHGPYSLAIALTYVFPRFSGDQTIAPSKTYWAHNVAVRRALLLHMPVPAPELLYRGQNIIHSKAAADLGYTIWRQPRARALHTLPSPLELPRRYFLLGRDSVNIARLARDESGQAYRGDMEPDCQSGSRFRKLVGRIRSVSADNPRHLLYLPLALPVMVVCAVCYYAGRLAASISSPPSVHPTAPASGRACGK